MEEVAHYPYHYTDTNGHRQEEEEEDDSEAERRRRERVGRMVGEWLAAPGDLELGKLDLLRRNVQNKANTTRAQLKAMVQAQLLSASKGMELLALSHQQIRGMQLNFEELERSNERCKGLIGQYPLLKAVNDARTNLLRTLREVDKTLQIPHKIEQVRALMEDDKNLASVYNEVKAMEKLRNIALKQAVNQDAEQRHLLEKVFEGVHSLLFDFKDRVFQLIRSALPSARERPESLVQAVQVIEQEQKLYEQQKSASDVPTEASDTTILLGGDDGSSPMEACLLHLRESIADRYREVFAECGDDIQRILRRTEPLLSDLSDVMQHVLPCFPKYYNIAVFYLVEYHERLRVMFAEYAAQADDLSTQEILSLVQWCQENYTPKVQALQVSIDENMELPPLMDALLPLMNSYKKDMGAMMDAWCSRLLQSDTKSEPEVIGGMYYTDAPILLFRFINQQIEVVQGSGSPKFIGGVVEECIRVLHRFQENTFHMLKDEWQGLYLEYLMALINNYSKCFEYTQELLHKSQKLLVSAEDEETLHGEFDLVAARFTLLADRTVDALANTIFEDLEEALKMLFKKEWYEEDITGQIIETLKDYFENEVKGHITEASFSKLAKECIERFLRRYVSELFNKKALPLSKKTVDRLKEDEELLRDLCRKHTNLREKHYKVYLQLLSDIRELLDSEPHMIVMYFNQLMQHNKDATLTMLTSLIQRRTDLDKGKMKEAIEACTQAAASIQEKRDNNEKEKGEDTEGREKNTLDASPREKTTGFFADVSTPTLSSKLQSVQNLLKKEDRK